jgi:hypothetical protein
MRLKRSGLDHHSSKREASSVAAGLPLDPLPVPDPDVLLLRTTRCELHSIDVPSIFISGLYLSHVRHGRSKKTLHSDSAQIVLMDEITTGFLGESPRPRRKATSWARNRITSPRVLAFGSQGDLKMRLVKFA